MTLAEKILSTGTRTFTSPIRAKYNQQPFRGVYVMQGKPYLQFMNGNLTLVTESGISDKDAEARIMAQLPPDLQVNDMLEMTQPHKNLKKGDRLRVIETGNGYITLGGIDNGLIRVPVDGDWLRDFTKWPDDYVRPWPEGKPTEPMVPTLIQEMTQLLAEIEQIKSRIQSIIKNHEKSI